MPFPRLAPRVKVTLSNLRYLVWDQDIYFYEMKNFNYPLFDEE
jgi:hypothetical protein